MAEREPRQRWGAQNVFKHLGASPQPVRDVAFGDGEIAALPGEAGNRILETYAQAGVVRLTTQDARVELFRAAPTLGESGVVFRSDAATTRLTVERSGEVTLFVSPGPAPNDPPPPVAQARPETASSAAERGPRVSLKGRLGAAPSFRTTQKGRFVGRFPLAVHEGEETTWHRVVVFDERAEKLQDALEKGSEVEVVGYLHTRQRTGRDGHAETLHEVYAAVVKVR